MPNINWSTHTYTFIYIHTCIYQWAADQRAKSVSVCNKRTINARMSSPQCEGIESNRALLPINLQFTYILPFIFAAAFFHFFACWLPFFIFNFQFFAFHLIFYCIPCVFVICSTFNLTVGRNCAKLLKGSSAHSARSARSADRTDSVAILHSTAD